ncbi:MAG: FhaA domain-containing protein [Ktedonobacterales bacterium]
MKSMGVMSKFESMMQGIVEGSFGRVFRSRLQPVELASKLTRAMDSNLQLGPERRIAPNLYDVYLSQRDYAYFMSFSRSLTQQLADSLINVARERGYMLPSRPIVRFHEDAGLITGQTHIETQVLDPRSLPDDNAADGDLGVEETRSMSPVEAQALARQVAQAQQAQVEPLPPAWLTLYRPARGKPMPITQPVLHLGRHLSNDVVINDKRVSRYHAEIRFEHGQFVLYDLGSTNGVGINGVMTHQPVPLKNNDMVSVGSHEFVFQRR